MQILFRKKTQPINWKIRPFKRRFIILSDSEENYSLVIYQSQKNRSRVYLQLRKGKRIQPERLYGGFKQVALRAFLIVRYARTHKVDFKEAWDANEVWTD
jgi:hypothetical protein